MNENRLSIDKLRIELERLQLAARNIERLIHQAEEDEQEEQRQLRERIISAEAVRVRRSNILEEDFPRRPRTNYNEIHPIIFDGRGTEILIGDTIQFMSTGRYNSREGVVYRISRTGSRVTARDDRGRAISRSPMNVLVILPREGE